MKMWFSQWRDLVVRNMDSLVRYLEYKGPEIKVRTWDKGLELTAGDREFVITEADYNALQDGDEAGLYDSICDFLVPLHRIEKWAGAASHWKNQAPICKRGREPHWTTPA